MDTRQRRFVDGGRGVSPSCIVSGLRFIAPHTSTTRARLTTRCVGSSRLARTPQEAWSSLANTSYGDKINPTHPLVPTQLFDAGHFSTLLREPILLAAMIATAARYLDLGLSFDAKEPSRSRVIQGRVVAWVLQRIGFLTMGEYVKRLRPIKMPQHMKS